MIAIARSTTVPASLLKVPASHTREVARLAKAGKLTSNDFDGTYYGAQDVRDALHAMQQGKCAYCEKPIERKHAHVDHFRPKTLATERNAQRNVLSKRPGYHWLAYVFDNLLLTCANCNNAKWDQFPLTKGAKPLPVGKLAKQAKERALLIDPTVLDPKRDIAFVEDPLRGGFVPTGLGKPTGRGATSVRVLALDRDDLTEMRRTYFRKSIEPLMQQWKAKGLSAKRKAEIGQQARLLVAPDAQFSAMAAAAFRHAGILP